MSLKSALLFVTAVFGFGSAFSMTNIAVTSISPMWVAAGRSVIAMLALWAFIFITKRPVFFDWALLRMYVTIGVFTGVLPYTLISWGQQYIESGLGGVLFASTPLLTLLIGYLAFNAPKPSTSTLCGAAIGLGGVALALASPADITTSAILGSTATVLASVSYAAGGLLIQCTNTKDIVGLTALQLVPASLMLVCLAVLLGGSFTHMPPIQSYAALFCLGVFGTCVPLLSLFALVAHEQAKIASLTTFFIPFVALAIGVVLLDEPFAILPVVGLLVTMFGAVLISQFGQKN